jgi:hypothetical protein
MGEGNSAVRIVFRQSGGFLGAPRECDTANLDDATARQAARLLEQAGVHGSREQTAPNARDATRYELTIIKDGTSTRVVTDDATVSPELLPLIEFLSEHCRPAPLKKRGAGD